MKRRSFFVFLIAFVFGFCVSQIKDANASVSEKEAISNSSYWGFIKNYDKKKYDSEKTRGLTVFHEVVYTTGNVRNLTIVYDEIWEADDAAFLTPAEIQKYKNDLNHIKIYWKNDKVQAYVIERKYTSTGAHEVTDIFDRAYILKNMR
ncbi:MAG: hypothetical protein AB1545_15630 [Thermodesulfobacteriota bacterium]